MATRQLPFRGESTAEIFESILNRQPIPITRINLDLPPELERIVNKALEKDRNLRYQHAADIRTDLKRLERDTSSGRIRISDIKQLLSLAPPRAAHSSSQPNPPMRATPPRQRAPGSNASQPAATEPKSSKGLMFGIAAILILLAVAAGIAYKFFGTKPAFNFHDMEISKLTQSGKAAGVAISPDGQYVVYVFATAKMKASRFARSPRAPTFPSCLLTSSSTTASHFLPMGNTSTSPLPTVRTLYTARSTRCPSSVARPSS